MRSALIIGLVLIGFACVAQPISLKVLGKHSYKVEAEAYGVVFTLEENTDKCDPVLGFVSLEEQYKHLTESFTALGVRGSASPVTDNTSSPYRKKTYRIEEEDQNVFDAILSDLTNKQAIVKKTYYKVPPHSFVDEDASALAALIDAKEKARILADHLDYKIARVLNVDDETSGAGQLFELAGGDPIKERLIFEMVEILEAKNPAFSEESNSSTRSGAYSIWVTFEIVPD